MPVIAYFYVSKRCIEERLLWEQRINLLRSLLAIDSTSFRCAGDLAESLFNYGNCLHNYETLDEPRGTRIQDAHAAQLEAIGTLRLLSLRDERFRGALALALHNHGITLCNMGRLLDACKVEEEAVSIRRQLYDGEPWALRYRAALAQSLYNYGLTLADTDAEGLLDCMEDACSVLKECVWLRRALLSPRTATGDSSSNASSVVIVQDDSRFQDRWGMDLALALHAFGWALHCAERYEEACAIKEEAVATLRTSPAHRRADLASALHNLGASLHRVGRIDDACAVYGEAVAIRRRDYEVDPGYHQADLEASIHDLKICLEMRESGKTD